MQRLTWLITGGEKKGERMQGEEIGKQWRSNEGHRDFKLHDLAGIRKPFGGLWKWVVLAKKVSCVSAKIEESEKKHKFHES